MNPFMIANPIIALALRLLGAPAISAPTLSKLENVVTGIFELVSTVTDAEKQEINTVFSTILGHVHTPAK